MDKQCLTPRPMFSDGAGRTKRPLAGSSLIAHPSSGRRSGFTFAELLAAMVFMAVLIPVAIHGLTIANRAGVVAERKRVAAELADRLLTEFVVTDEWRSADRQGDFGEEWPGFRWVLDDEAWGEDTVRLLSVEVIFAAQGREFSVRLSTLVQEEEEEEEQ